MVLRSREWAEPRLGLVHHVNETNCLKLQTPDGAFSVLGKVELQTNFSGARKVELQTNFSGASSTNVDGKNKSIDSVEFLVLGSDWPGPDLVLGNPCESETEPETDSSDPDHQ
ncbi:10182_t:CDS:2 [Entrophospora sp. SA101]|nr:10182_t:CDS:2 [Entrophospora sp. SA101]